MFRWAHALGLDPLLVWLRSGTGSLRPLPSWFLYSLPDGLWLYAFTYGMRSTWRTEIARGRTDAIAWGLAPLALAIGSEAAQGVGWLQGTFDPIDVCTYVLAFVLAVVATQAPRAVAMETAS